MCNIIVFLNDPEFVKESIRKKKHHLYHSAFKYSTRMNKMDYMISEEMVGMCGLWGRMANDRRFYDENSRPSIR